MRKVVIAGVLGLVTFQVYVMGHQDKVIQAQREELRRMVATSCGFKAENFKVRPDKPGQVVNKEF